MEFVADILYDLPKNYSHVFDLVHFILCIQGERNDMTPQELQTIPKKHPFALWLSSMMICFAGGILLGPIAGESALDAMEDGSKVLMASLVWYLLFYVDPAFDLSKRFEVKVPLYVLKGMYYPKKILAGIRFAKKEYKRNLVALILIPVVKGNGSGFMKPFARAVRMSGRISESIETISPSLTTKYVFLATLVNLLVPGDLAYIGSVGALIAMKAGPLFGLNVAKPFELANEKVFPKIFGGDVPPVAESAPEKKTKEE